VRCLPIALALLAASGCTTSFYEERADRRVGAILTEGTRTTLERRAREARNVPAPRTELAPEAGPTTGPSGEPDLSRWPELDGTPLTLRRALLIAIRTNRDYLREIENLYLSALSLYDARFVFSPQLSATLAYLFSDTKGSPIQRDATFDASLSQVLHHGGTLTLGTDATFSNPGQAVSTYDAGASISLVQPLLRGAGYEVTHNLLIQAERNLMYDLRAFELFREDFSIDVARRFYALVEQQQSLENLRQNVESFEFSRRQSEALFDVGRAPELDVLRARRNELQSLNTAISAEQDLQLAIDQFKIFLGLPTEVSLEIAMIAPEFTDVEFDIDSAVRVALINRLDFLTERERLEDSARNLRIVENGLLPDLDLDLTWSLNGDPATNANRVSFDPAVSGGVTFGLPVNRVVQQNAMQAARIAYKRAERALEQFEDNLVIEIRNSFRELERRKQSLAIQRELITDQEKNLRIARIRFEQGEVPNRDIVEAQQALTGARNDLIQERVDYEISRLRLLRNLGILFIDEQGMWSEV